MNAGTDFLMLYKELRLRPGCALDEFRVAYRRRVAELHPDRVQHQLYEDAAARLSSLNAMYAAAMEFHKQHGRLPGEVASYRPELMPQRPASQARPPAPEAPAPAAHARRHTSWFVTALLILAALIVGWLLGAVEHDDGDQSSTSLPEPVIARAGALAPIAPVVAHVVRIRVGMDSDRVVEIEGEPVMTGEDRWEYGPSWITFHCGAVLDWYSSPLRPLKVESQHAPADEVEREAQLKVPGCVKPSAG
ncbi:MAG TPA: J domain-containing protein [Rhodanobacteraceae bacterium]|nr:J domain-containing protein [Rhodanobacteraceae bacterium]